MRKRGLGLAWLGGALLAAGTAQAQYSAPGFPMLPQGRPQPAAKVVPRLLSAVLPRFWHETDVSKHSAGRTKFFEFVSAQAKFPDGARPGPGQPEALLPTGLWLVRVLVRPDGYVRQPPLVTRRELPRPESSYPPAALRALDAEAQRVLGALRFVRSKTLVDTLVVPMRFLTQ